MKLTGKKHELKIEPYHFTPILSGEKTYLITPQSRGGAFRTTNPYNRGDLLNLIDYDSAPAVMGPTGRELEVVITQTGFEGVRRDFVVLGIMKQSDLIKLEAGGRVPHLYGEAGHDELEAFVQEYHKRIKEAEANELEG